MNRPWTRRELLRAVGLAALGPPVLHAATSRPIEDPPASFLGEAVLRGHRTRGVDPTKLPVDREPDVDVVIVGAGFAGLVAATALDRAGIGDLYVAELDDVVGGHAQRRSLGGVPVQFGPQAFDAPTGEADQPASYAEFLADQCRGVTPRELRLRRSVAGEWTFGDPGEVGPRLTAAAVAALGGKDAAASYAGRRRGAAALDARSGEDFLRASTMDEAARDRLRLYARARFGVRAEFVAAGVLLEDYLRRGAACGGRRLLPPESPGGVAERMAASLGDRLRKNRVVLKVVTTEQGVLAYVVDPLTNYVDRVRARAAVVAIPPFAAREVCPALAAGGRLDDLPETSVWLASVFGLKAAPDFASPPADLYAPNFGSSSALQRIFAAEREPASPDPLRPPFALLDLRPFPGAAAMPSRIMLSRTMPWELRDFAFRETQALRPGLRDLTTRVDFLRVGHGPMRPAPGRSADAVLRAASAPGPYFPAGADWTGTPSLETAITSGKAAADAAATYLRRTASRPESRDR